MIDTQTLEKDTNLVAFIHGVNKKIRDYWTRMNFTHSEPPVVLVHNIGKRYARLASFKRNVVTGKLAAESVYCFYDFTNGDLLKGSWKASVANGVRGNVKESNVLDKFTEYGPKYLNGR